MTTRDPAPVPPRLEPLATPSMIIGIAGLLLPVVLLSAVAIWLGIWSRRRILRSAEPLAGAHQAIAGIITGILGLAFFLILAIVVQVLVRPSLVASQEGYRQQTEEQNVQTLTGGLLQYAMLNGGKLPSSLAELARSGIVPPGNVYITVGAGIRPPYNADDIAEGDTSYTFHLPGVAIEKVPERERTVMLSADGLPDIVTVAMADGNVRQVIAANLEAAVTEHGWLLPRTTD